MSEVTEARAGWIVSMIAVAMTFAGSLVVISARAGELENRVKVLETTQQTINSRLDLIYEKIESTSEAVARIEERQKK